MTKTAKHAAVRCGADDWLGLEQLCRYITRSTGCQHHRPVRLSWAKLLKRDYEIDIEHCPYGGGELRIIAAISEQPVIEKILSHLGLQATAPPRAPARGPRPQAA